MNSFSFIGKIAYINLKYIQYYTIWTKNKEINKKSNKDSPITL